MSKVLIVEDDPLAARMYQKALSLEGFEVESAIDGEQGVQKAKEFKPDIIYCDVMMPRVSGIELLEQLKQDPAIADIPVIMLTNLSGKHDAELALKKGATSYLVKSENKPTDIVVHAKQFLASSSGKN